ncbi:probable NAD(P)H-nitrite reductase [Phialocephala subalpina]|uniref:Nitrite reductase [NAD(P)H] n=1 Tax=Phialocephala subalpina TaxID=576137 RepID=A0A1L7WL39_9HELO|nr:probable NAD(P)H-nitrite reductase [Phialocephala subalpina]
MAVDGVPSTSSNGTSERKRVVVVGLGMVGIIFVEKLMKLDVKRREYEIVIIGEEPHLAYNRVGLTSFFEHRDVERLYMQTQAWYDAMPTGSLSYYLNTLATAIDSEKKTVTTAKGGTIEYDILVLATGSDAILPKVIPGHDATGVFVYRTIADLQKLIAFSATKKGTTGVVVGGGLLGLEAAKAMMDLQEFGKIKVIESIPYVLGRQVDAEGGAMVVEQVRDLGVDLILGKMVNKILTDENHCVTGVEFKDGDTVEGTCVCFAIGVSPRDDLARKSGLTVGPRGGIIVGDDLQTSVKNIYAIGECANWGGMCYGLYGPGIEMADILAFNLTDAKFHSPRFLTAPDMSTKLKLLGIGVASFGDAFADQFGPAWLPGKRQNKEIEKTMVKALTYKDPFTHVYKKYLFTKDGKYLLGGMMVGDTNDYIKLLSMSKSHKMLEVAPGELIIGKAGGDDGADDLPDDAQICSCNNVTKGDITKTIKDGTCKTVNEIKTCTKAGTGCGGCVPLVTSIFNKTMADMGQEVKNVLCSHFAYSRADLFNIVMVKKLESFEAIMNECGQPGSLGCEFCKPAVASIIASLFNKHVVDPSRKGLQDTNDKFLANIQRNGTFSVVPRVPGGEITPKKLAAIASVATKYNLYCKITGGQRIDMFGAKKQDLLDIWTELIEAGLESGHAYAKSLRTVKSCVGSSWCRFGIGDSVGMAIRIEERYKSIRGPHKIKGGVSGCVRECAEAQNKDFGLIATEKGFNIYVGGNGGAKPRHSEILAKDVPVDQVIPILDRYLAFYIRTADRLQRTARWIENLPGGIKYLRQVILEDKLGICAALEKQMEELVSSFFCEWTEAVKSPERRKQFQQFANTPETVLSIEPTIERGQTRPSNWVTDSVTEDFRSTKWSTLSWQPIVETSKFQDIATGDSNAVKRGDTQLAIFKIRGKYYCTQQMCPHKRAFILSDGLIGEDLANNKQWVSCPLHKRNWSRESLLKRGLMGLIVVDIINKGLPTPPPIKQILVEGIIAEKGTNGIDW